MSCINVKVQKITKPIKVKCGIVCALEGMKKYLIVEDKTLWLKVDNSFTDTMWIKSNTNWKIQ